MSDSGVSRRIVLTSWGAFGDLYPYIGLGRALKARGHDVVLAVPGFHRDVVEAAGLVCARRAAEVAETIRAERGAEAAADAVERVLAGTPV